MKERNFKILTIAISVLIILSAAVLTVLIIERGKQSTVIMPTIHTTEPKTEDIGPTINLSELNTNYHIKQPIGRVISEDLDINCKLIYGVTKECLRIGAGMHTCSNIPGLKTPQNFDSTCPVIAAHVMTLFQNFKVFDPAVTGGNMPEGKTITLSMPYGDFVYEIVKAEIIEADDFVFTEHRANHGGFEVDTVLFYTCYPFERVSYSKHQRLFLTGKLKSSTVTVIDDRLDTDKDSGSASQNDNLINE